MGRILNFGSLNIDHVYSVPRFLQPGETLSATAYEVFPGGKGLNQSIALARAGANVWHAGKIGTEGVWLRELLDAAGVHTDYVSLCEEKPGHTVIQIDRLGQNCILLYAGANGAITTDFMQRVISGFSAGDVLVLQNEINLTEDIINAAVKKGMQIALNPSPMTPALLKCSLEKVTWFLLNEVEGEQMTGETEPEKIAGALLRQYPKSRIVLTLGPRGVLYLSESERCSHRSFCVPVVDTTAAGDTFTGFFLSSATNGAPVEESLEIASAAAAIAVSRKGAAVSIPTMAEVLSSGICISHRQ